MREIKFRAWDKELGEMLNLLALRDNTGNVLMQRFNQPKTIIHSKPKDVEIMQFTGLTDKNGKEIFEGDIVLTKEITAYDKLKNFNATIAWNKISAGWVIRPIIGNATGKALPVVLGYINMEVIGNIYENKDLLKEAANA